MAPLGPFERSGHLAVAVSGGPDSLALTLLAAAWAGTGGRRITALTVDHGLRLESAAEASQVGDWLGARGIAHHVLRWRGAKPATRIQATARAERYRLLLGWCRRHRVHDLLVGHQLEDQAETLLMRLTRGSGLDGWAAMAPVSALDGVRLLRPLLDVSTARLRATLQRRGQPWLEDPSNTDPRFTRTRAGQALAQLAAGHLLAGRLGGTAARLARARRALDATADALLAAAVTIAPAGYARIDSAALFAAPDEIALRALARALTCVSGAWSPPRLERLEHLHEELRECRAPGGRTLHGCRVLVRPGELLVCREARRIQAPLPLTAGKACLWDGRFRVKARARRGRTLAAGLTVGTLGTLGWREVVAVEPSLKGTAPPAPIRQTLPALRAGERVVAVPHLDFVAASGTEWLASASAEFRPRYPISAER